MAMTAKYTFKDINDIMNSGFSFEIPNDVIETINYLCSNVGSPLVTNNVYNKSSMKEEEMEIKNKKKKGNKAMEVSEEEWESIRTFQPTKLDQKNGLDADIDEIRLFLNKLTDKTFLDMRLKIINKIEVIENSGSIVDKEKVSQTLYDISSTNRFYSKVFADLFAELAIKYKWINETFNNNKKELLKIYENIKYVDSDKDYDGFCEMNKVNEKRKSITTFYLNLSLNGYIKKSFIIDLLKNILTTIINMIEKMDKKNEVDELTEIVAILFNKDMIEEVCNDTDDEDNYYVGDNTIMSVINNLAQQKAKNYPSLSNKAIFKYMDLIEM